LHSQPTWGTAGGAISARCCGAPVISALLLAALLPVIALARERGVPGLHRERGRLRERAPGSRRVDLDSRPTAGDPSIPGLLDRHQRRPTASRSTSRSTRRPAGVTASTSTASATYGRARLAGWSRRSSRSVPFSPGTAGVPDRPRPPGLIDCGNWGPSRRPGRFRPDAVSGIYAAQPRPHRHGREQRDLLRRPATTSGPRRDAVPDLGRDLGGLPNAYGGKPASTSAIQPAAPYKVSYKPAARRQGHLDPQLAALQPSGRCSSSWRRTATDVSYATRRRHPCAPPPSLLEHKVFLSVGHDEYWSAESAARRTSWPPGTRGSISGFFGANGLFWKTRLGAEQSPRGAAPLRTLVTYKESKSLGSPIDPADPPVSTGTWREPRAFAKRPTAASPRTR